MKRYYKNGEIKSQSAIVIKQNGITLCTPTEEEILADGWIDYDNTLDGAKENLINEVKAYDKSESVECVYIKGEKTWYNKQERVAIMNLATCYKNKEINSCVLFVNGSPYTYTCDALIDMLTQLEIYASECFNATQTNINSIKTLLTLDEVKSFDYISKYPTPLEFL
jgi:hypothetical protein